MNHVAGKVVLAPGDEDLGALDRPRSIAARGRDGTQRADVGPGLRLGQVHRPRPFAADQPGEVDVLLRRAAVMADRFDRADGEHWEQAKGHVGGAEVLDHIGRQGEGQALAAEVRIARDRVPTLFDIVLIGLGKARGQRDDAVRQYRTLLVADPVERRPFARSELADALDNGRDHVRAGSREPVVRGKVFDPSIDPDREDLVGSVGSIVHRRAPALFLGFAENGL